ncbi:RHS repeat-associated core domain-containing protein, partial [Haloferula chungangensis]
DGVLQARYDYDAYGKRMTITQSAGYLGGCDFGYTGHFTRTALVAGKTELVLAHYRAYDPALGRWLSEDAGGEWDGIHLFAFVGGDALNYVDPLGLFKMNWREFGKGFVIGLVVGAAVTTALMFAPVVIAATATVALAGVGVVQGIRIVNNWDCMSDDDKSNVTGNLLGGMVGGGLPGVRPGTSFGYLKGTNRGPQPTAFSHAVARKHFKAMGVKEGKGFSSAGLRGRRLTVTLCPEVDITCTTNQRAERPTQRVIRWLEFLGSRIECHPFTECRFRGAPAHHWRLIWEAGVHKRLVVRK